MKDQSKIPEKFIGSVTFSFIYLLSPTFIPFCMMGNDYIKVPFYLYGKVYVVQATGASCAWMAGKFKASEGCPNTVPVQYSTVWFCYLFEFFFGVKTKKKVDPY